MVVRCIVGCGCRAEGTLQEDGVTTPPCTLVEGQCTCAKPGIIGRTCDHCAEGTTSELRIDTTRKLTLNNIYQFNAELSFKCI